MGETDQPAALIYQLRAVLCGISPLIWRRLLVRSDSTVAQPRSILDWFHIVRRESLREVIPLVA